ncbi:hypothetical protein AB0H83_35000 [Dactylosporangium sp. NPDC050688]|uniref:hypothetical protein n=1 Tax=Dactylosporangium sp. NPDC050688 TaxID=3157217 RepID=UPI0034101AF9
MPHLSAWLGAWLKLQRTKLRNGTLFAARAHALDGPQPHLAPAVTRRAATMQHAA